MATTSEQILDKLLGLDNPIQYGWPDRAIVVNGKLIGIEYKNGTDTLSNEQRQRLTQIIQSGGRAFVVRLIEFNPDKPDTHYKRRLSDANDWGRKRRNLLELFKQGTKPAQAYKILDCSRSLAYRVYQDFMAGKRAKSGD